MSIRFPSYLLTMSVFLLWIFLFLSTPPLLLGIGEKLLEHVRLDALLTSINQTLDDVVDKSIHDLAKVYHSGNLCPFQRKVLSKMAHKETIFIEILGGSATFGADLRHKTEERWSHRFEQIMNSGWYDGSISVANRAIPACNIDAWVHQTTRFRAADLVIVDLSVNDQGFQLQSLPKYYETLVQLLDVLPNRPAILFHQAFRTAKHDESDIRKNCPEGQSARIESDGGTYLLCKKWWDMQDYVAQTLDEYSVPFVSYRDLVWPDYSKPPAALPHFWNGQSHPDHKVHALMAKLIAYGVRSLIEEAEHVHGCHEKESERYVSKHGDKEERMKTALTACPAPLLKLQASLEPSSEAEFLPHMTLTHAASPSSAGWRFYNDTGLKYGWILDATQEQLKATNTACPPTRRHLQSLRHLAAGACEDFTAAASLSFKMTFGDTPVLQLSYLKSYTDNMGAARVWVDDDRSHFVDLASKWDDPYSVAHYTTLSAVPLNVSTYALGEWRQLASLTPGPHTVHIGPVPFSGEQFKWKLYSVTSC